MARLHISLLLHLLSMFVATGISEPTSRSQHFIEASCRATRYQSLCIACISSYVNATNATLTSPQELSQISLSISLVKARFTQAYILQVSKNMSKGQYKWVEDSNKDDQNMQDCLTQINDSVFRLSQSIHELRRMVRNEGEDFMWRMSNVDAWVSAALTDASMCVDEFSGGAMSGKTKATIKAKVVNVAQVTSNALALFHRYTRRHRVSGSTKKP